MTRETVGRCQACDADVHQGDTQCPFCKCPKIVPPYPEAKTIDQAVANIFEHDTKSSRIVEQILKGEWPEEHGVQSLSGQVASEYHAGTGIWASSDDCIAGVRRGLAKKRAN